MKFAYGFERKVFVGNGYNAQIVHNVIVCCKDFSDAARDCHKKVNAHHENNQLSRAEFFLLVVLVELVLILFAKPFSFILFEAACGKRLHGL